MEIEISSRNSEYMHSIIQKIINECGPRMPCSPQEAHSAEIIKGELKKTCDKVEIEIFFCHPRAFLGYIKINVILIFISFAVFFFLPSIGNYIWETMISVFIFFLNLMSFMILYYEFFNYKEFIDPLFKKKESQNVVGSILPENEIENIIIFSGHHDSALQFNLLRYLKVGYPIIIFLGLGIMVFWLLLSILNTILILFGIQFYKIIFDLVIWLFIIAIIPFVALFNFTTPGEKANKVPGAVDNLSAVAIVLGIGNYIKDNKDIIPTKTEIRLISFGCEEAGLRGAYRYAEKHYNELKAKNTMIINMDGIQSKNNIKIIEYEPTTRTTHSKDLVDKVVYASKKIQIKAKPFGSELKERLIGQISGGTDATAFSKIGIKATTISAMEMKRLIDFYHQPSDTLDKIEAGSLENVLKICLSFLSIIGDF